MWGQGRVPGQALHMHTPAPCILKSLDPQGSSNPSFIKEKHREAKRIWDLEPLGMNPRIPECPRNFHSVSLLTGLVFFLSRHLISGWGRSTPGRMARGVGMLAQCFPKSGMWITRVHGRGQDLE